MVAQQVLARRWDLGSQPADELVGCEEDVGLARPLGLGQLVGDAAVASLRELGVGVRASVPCRGLLTRKTGIPTEIRP